MRGENSFVVKVRSTGTSGMTALGISGGTNGDFGPPSDYTLFVSHIGSSGGSLVDRLLRASLRSPSEPRPPLPSPSDDLHRY